MNNIKFNYLYRDGSNFKSWGEVIFSNPEKMTVNEIETKLLNAFLLDKQFIASQISIPEKFLFENENFTNYDHCFHEFDCVEVCQENSADDSEFSISDFLIKVELVSKQGWKAFYILDRA
jgi:cytochrome c-type biogenesis protein CcmH/NrfF